MIRAVTPNDAKQLAAIYNHYVLNTVVTFDDVPFSEEEFKHKIAGIVCVIAHQRGACAKILCRHDLFRRKSPLTRICAALYARRRAYTFRRA